MRLACIALLALALAPAAQEGTSQGEIVFVGVHVTRASGVLEFDADGTHQARLATGNISNLVVARDGAIAYTQLNATQVIETVVLSDGRGQRLLGRGRALGFSPDGSTLAIARPDTALALYDRPSGLVRATLPPVDHLAGWAGGSLLYEAGLADHNELHVLGATDRTLVSLNGPIVATGSPDGRRVAYTTPDGLHIVNSDGSGERTPVAPCSGRVAWSPDSTRVACVANDSLTFANVDGSVEMIAVPGSAASEGSWSPDGTQFAFTTDSDVDIATLATGAVREAVHGGRVPQWSPDGRTLAVAFGEGINTAVVPASGGALRVVARDASPAWLPNGRLLAVVSQHDENEVATMLPSGRGFHLIAHTAGATHPELSPDRSKLAYETLTDGPTNVFACKADGTHRLLLARAGTGVTDVAWSPNGRRIAFVDDRGIKLVAPSGGPTHLVPHTGGAVNVAWSPDGTQLAYAIYGPTTTELDVVGSDGRHRHVVVGKRRPLWTDGGISWSPDGTHIAFALDYQLENGEDIPSLAIVNVHSRYITELGNDDQNPAWSPDGKTIATDYYGSDIHLIDVAEPGDEVTLAPGSDPSWSP